MTFASCIGRKSEISEILRQINVKENFKLFGKTTASETFVVCIANRSVASSGIQQTKNSILLKSNLFGNSKFSSIELLVTSSKWTTLYFDNLGHYMLHAQ